jgi:hypothetical protein
MNKLITKLCCVILITGFAVSAHAAEWQRVQTGISGSLWVYPVINGWLVKYDRSLTFVPDPKHEWKP